MASASPQIRFTYQDLLLREPDHYRHELFEGVHHMSPSPSILHQRLVKKLLRFLSDYVETDDLGEVFVSPVDVVFDEFNVCIPDISYVQKSRMSIVTEKRIDGAPDLMIEIISPSTEKVDRELKYKRYMFFGVKEYWLVDPVEQSIEIFDLAQDKCLIKISTEGQISSMLLPGLQLDIADLF